ncbi:hypothetical protein D3C76_1503220 [compost metagenome]
MISSSDSFISGMIQSDICYSSVNACLPLLTYRRAVIMQMRSLIISAEIISCVNTCRALHPGLQNECAILCDKTHFF